MHRRKYKVSKYSHVGWIQCKSLRQNGDSRMILDVKSVTSSIGRCLIVNKAYLCQVCRANLVHTPMLVVDLDSKCTIEDTWHRMMQGINVSHCAGDESMIRALVTLEQSQICMRRIWNSISIEYHRSTCTRTTLHSVCVIDREYMTLIQYHTSIHDVQDPSLCQAGTSYRREVIVVLRYEADARYNSVV